MEKNRAEAFYGRSSCHHYYNYGFGIKSSAQTYLATFILKIIESP